MTNEEYLYALKTLYMPPNSRTTAPGAIPLPSAVALRLGAKGVGPSIFTQFAQAQCGDERRPILGCPTPQWPSSANASADDADAAEPNKQQTNKIADAVLDRQRERYLIDYCLLIKRPAEADVASTSTGLTSSNQSWEGQAGRG